MGQKGSWGLRTRDISANKEQPTLLLPPPVCSSEGPFERAWLGKKNRADSGHNRFKVSGSSASFHFSFVKVVDNSPGLQTNGTPSFPTFWFRDWWGIISVQNKMATECVLRQGTAAPVALSKRSTQKMAQQIAKHSQCSPFPALAQSITISFAGLLSAGWTWTMHGIEELWCNPRREKVSKYQSGTHITSIIKEPIDVNCFLALLHLEDGACLMLCYQSIKIH